MRVQTSQFERATWPAVLLVAPLLIATTAHAKPCDLKLPGSAPFAAGASFELDFAQFGINVHTVDQSECTTIPPATVDKSIVSLNLDTSTAGKNRLYRITYSCGKSLNRETLDFEVQRNGGAGLTGAQIALWFPALTAGNCSKGLPCQALKLAFRDVPLTHEPGQTWRFNFNDYRNVIVDGIEQSECASHQTASLEEGLATFELETNAPGANRWYQINYRCGTYGKPEVQYLEVKRSGAKTVFAYEVPEWHSALVPTKGCVATPK